MPELTLEPTLWHWMILALVLVAIEVFAPGTFFLWMGISAAVVGLLVWLMPALGFEYQVLAFALLSMGAILVSRRFLRRHPIVSDQPLLNRRGARYVGRHFVLTEPIVNGRGKVRVDDTVWRIEGADCPAGSRVEVTGVDGVVLRVTKSET